MQSEQPTRKIDKNIEIRFDHVGEIQTGGGIWRIVLGVFLTKPNKRLDKWYEIWATEEIISDTLRIARFPTKEDAIDFGEQKFKERYRNNGNKIPPEGGILYSHKSPPVKELKADALMAHIPNQVRTNLNLPKSLYEWAKGEASRSDKSLSELVREALKRKKLKNFYCDICDAQLASGEITYQHYDRVTEYLPWPKDIKLGPRDLIRICSECSEKYEIKSLIGKPETYWAEEDRARK